ncbi:MAG: aminoglycoside phosphotransferase family protein [Nitrospiraceae bacterium]
MMVSPTGTRLQGGCLVVVDGERIAALRFRDKVPEAAYNAIDMAAVDRSQPKQVLLPPDPKVLAKTVRSKLPFPAELAQLVALERDASNRRYFRLKLNGGPPDSLVLMQLAEPEAFKQSEEAVSSSSVEITELPFTNILRHLASAGVLVPRLFHYDQQAGLLFLEDFGDLTLTHATATLAPQELRELYYLAIDLLATMQVKGTPRETASHPRCLAFGRAFDVPLLLWEFNHFLEYGVVARRGQPMCADDHETVREEFRKIAELLAGQPQVFTHRDYHSRNLMVRDAHARTGRLGVLDFQDALMGPTTYDLASLLRDAYVELEEALVDELLSYYLERMAEYGMAFSDRLDFRRLFDFTSIQRNLKAAGRFAYIDRVKKNPKFLADIPRTLGYVRRNLAKYPELARLRKHLAPYVPELQ